VKDSKKSQKELFFDGDFLDLKNINYEKLRRSLVLRSLTRDYLINNYLNNPTFDQALVDMNDIRVWCDLNNIKNDSELEKWKELNFFDKTSFKDLVKRDLRWGSWCLERYKNDIENQYLNSDQFIEMVDYSLLRSSNENLINELYLRIIEKEDTFENLAEKFSEGDEKYSRGRIGLTHINTSHPQISKILKNSVPLKVNPPHKIESWWILIRLNQSKKNKLDNTQKLRIALKKGEELIQKQLNNMYRKL